MNLRVRINNDAFERIRARVRAMELSEGDRRGPVLIALDRTHVDQVRAAFTSQGRSVATGPWPPWSARYAGWRRRHGHGTRMLRLTNTMYGKFTQPSHPSHIRRWEGGLAYSFGALDDVAAWHQEGAGHLPVRSVVDKTVGDHRELVSTFSDFYRKRVRQVLRHA